MSHPDPEGLRPDAPVVEDVAGLGDQVIAEGDAAVAVEPVVDGAPTGEDEQHPAAEPQVDPQLERWRDEWRQALDANKNAGPQLATAFRDSKYGGPKAEFVDADEITPDVLMVRIMRKPNLWA